MTEVWRVCARQFASPGLTGEGTRLYGGRWNPPGVAIAYTAATQSLAALELFVNVDPDNLPRDLVSIAASIPDNVRIDVLSENRLPGNWRDYPAPDSLQVIGATWAAEARSAVLAVPSAVIPRERNYLLNPRHSEFPRIMAGAPEPFHFDPRMWK